MKNLLVVLTVDDKQKEYIKSMATDCEVVFTDKTKVTLEEVKNADMIMGNPPAKFVKECEHLELLQLESAGTDDYIKDVLKEGTVLTNATGAYGLAISEYMLAGVLHLCKRFNVYSNQQKAHEWNNLGTGSMKSIYGATVLVMGLGDIGGDFARKAKALGAYTIGLRRVGTDKPDYLDEIHLTEELDELLPKADIVAMSLPGTPATYHIINEDRLKMMKKDAIIVNVGRGKAIDQDALYKVMSEGHLFGAALDVTDPEPLPADSKLWDLDNVLITPHVSGGHTLLETFERIVRIGAENVKNHLEGKPLKNVVDFSTGYRKL